MSSHSPPIEGSALAAGDAVRIWVRHLTSLLLPVNALAFLFTGPHAWYVAALFMLPVVAAFVLDDGARVEQRQPDEALPGWPFDALVYLLAGLQIAVVFGIARMFAVQDFFSVDMIVLITVVGGSSGFSIITAHELIHRRKPWERQLGRLLLCTVLQEHFFTEHLRGHHVRVGTPEDPATARFGESYGDFYRRTVPAQFKSAWQLEKKRLEAASGEVGGWVAGLARNRIVQGLVVGWGIAALVGVTAGLAAFAAFLLQAFFSSRLLEAVNYFEHWGLMRSGSRVRPRDSWDTHSWFTYYGLVGLSRHADHHYEQARPFQQLRVYDDVPMLPSGYVGMVDMVMTRNEDFQRLATEELRRCGLGPFADGAEPEVPSAPAPSGWLASWRGQPAWLRGGLSASVFLLVVTAGARLLGESTAAMIPALAWNAWILAAFVVVFRLENRLSARGVNPVLGWSLALGLLVVLGLVSERAVALLA
jgi:alkane 1-monooxygenase